MDETKNGLVNPPTPPPSPAAPSGAAPKSDDLVYNVMPQEGKSFSVNFDASKSAPGPMVNGVKPAGSRKWTYLILGLLVLLVLGGLAYYLLGTNNKKADDVAQTPVTKLSKAWLQQYFNAETCTDQATCGDAADPDNDGLNNFVEFKTNTNPLNPDTDSDGLADGDEANIYKTDPTLKYTDRREIVATNDWSDGYQVKNGYDPVTGAKMTDARLKQIADAIVKFHLHDPSITTTTSVVTPAPAPTDTKTTTGTPKTINITIQNSAFSTTSLAVKAGDTVIWTNKDSMAHTVTSDSSGVFNSPNLSTNQTFSYTFKTAGTFAYHCTIHPNMKATIVVQ